MRKHKRYMAKRNMEKAGIKHFNRHTKANGERKDSYFALNWRDYVHPEG